MSISINERRDNIIYFLLNKVKHSEDKAEDISYPPLDFQGKIVEKDEVLKHLEYVIKQDYLKGEIVDVTNTSQQGNEAPFAICKMRKLLQKH